MGKYKRRRTFEAPAEKEDSLTVEGIVVENLPQAKFRVKLLEGEDMEMIVHVSGKMRINWIRILPGDKVKIELSSYDLNNGRIVYRYR